MVSIDYDTSDFGDPTEPKSLDKVTLTNDSSETMEFSVSYTYVETSAVEVHSEETKSYEHSFGITTGFEIKIPFIGDTGVESSYEYTNNKSYTSGTANTNESTKEVTKEVAVSVAPGTSTLFTVTQYQEEVQDIGYTATHILTFDDATTMSTQVSGKMSGVVVSNVLFSVVETALI